MSNYSVIASWSTKDALPSGNANKIVSATELGLEFASLATMSGTKEDSVNKDAASGYAGLDASARLKAAEFPAFTGDVTNTAGTIAMVIANNAVTNAKAAQMAAHTHKGNNTGSTANAIDLTQAQLTAEINVFTTALSGTVPASGGGTSNFLRADGTWTLAGLPTLAKYKTAQTARNTTITLADDPHLIFTALPAGTYQLRAFLNIQNVTSNTQGIQFSFRVAGTLSGTNSFAYEAVLNGAAASGMNNTLGATLQVTNVSTASNTDFFVIDGAFTTTTSGDFALQWSQRASSANNTIIQDRSYIVLTQIA